MYVANISHHLWDIVSVLGAADEFSHRVSSLSRTRPVTVLFMLFLRSKKSLLVHRMGEELSQRTLSATQLPEDESFFHYTSGRWLYNEKER